MRPASVRWQTQSRDARSSHHQIRQSANTFVIVATLADNPSGPIYDESGAHLVTPRFGTVQKTPPLATVKPPQVSDISADREYVFLGDENGWQIRQMQYRYQRGSLVHVDDPEGHMDRHADTRRMTEQERLACLAVH